MSNKRWMEVLSRRDFISLGTTAGVAVILSGCAFKNVINKSPNEVLSSNPDEFLKLYGPIDRTVTGAPQTIFSGDNNTRPHKILWDLESYFATKKVEIEEEANLVIVGGGASGLFSAFHFKDQNPIILEQAARLGGNAKGESWKGLDYGLGSAYIDEPREGSPMDFYYKELGLSNVLVEREKADPIEYKGKLFYKFWEGESDPEHKAAYEKIGQFLSDVYEEKERAFPLIPSLTKEHWESVKYYDQYDLHTLLTKVAGGKIPSQLESALEHYCWSTYAGSSKELSAAAVFNFLAQEARPIKVGAGGNAKIVEQLAGRLLKDIPEQNFRTSSIVVKVKVENNKTFVWYEDKEGKLHKITAKACIMSCPKFVVKRILEDIEPERTEAIEKIKYRSYMTANLWLKKRAPGNYYDFFMINEGKTDLNNIQKAQEKMNATDFVMANFAGKNDDISVLTFFRAFPYDGARSELYQPESYKKYKKKFEKQIKEKILPMLKMSESDIENLRLTLWGHALPLAEKGLYTDGFIDTLRKPHKERVFFVEQDNWAYPSLQTGATDIALLKDQIRKVI